MMRFKAIGDDLVQLAAVLLEIGSRPDVAVVADGLAANALNRQGVQQKVRGGLQPADFFTAKFENSDPVAH
jgi:hypothetical protein